MFFLKGEEKDLNTLLLELELVSKNTIASVSFWVCQPSVAHQVLTWLGTGPQLLCSVNVAMPVTDRNTKTNAEKKAFSQVSAPGFLLSFSILKNRGTSIFFKITRF